MLVGELEYTMRKCSYPPSGIGKVKMWVDTPTSTAFSSGDCPKKVRIP